MRAILVTLLSSLLMANLPVLAIELPSRETVASLVQPYVDAERLNAVSIAVVTESETQSYHFGQLSRNRPEAPTDTTIYEVGSVSKVFTSLLLARAVEAGQVSLDTTLTELLPEVVKKNPTVGSITLQQLATHTSGLPRLPSNMDATAKDPYATYGRQAMHEFLGEYVRQDTSNTEAIYSNLGAGLLGDLLVMKAGQDYHQLLVSQLADPLGMSDTSVRVSTENQTKVAPPHTGDNKPTNAWNFDALNGAGGVRSSIRDMVKLIRLHLTPADSRLRDAIEIAWQEKLPARGQGFAMGLGWHIARDGATRWHNGQTGGYHSMVMINRNLGAGVVVLSNTASPIVDSSPNP